MTYIVSDFWHTSYDGVKIQTEMIKFGSSFLKLETFTSFLAKIGTTESRILASGAYLSSKGW